jgi:Ca2+-dependent lipid-binding protein
VAALRCAPHAPRCPKHAACAARQLLRLVLEELPAWVRSGRYERTDWVSGALQTLWPHLERSLCRELQRASEPLLRSLAPAFVRRVRLRELSLGSCAPRVTCALCADADGGCCELEAEVRWACDGRALLACDLRAGRRLAFGVHDLQLSGLLRVRLAPLCARAPGFAAVSVCFAAPPTVRYRLSGVGAVASAVPGFAAYLQRCLGDALAAAAVWPRQLVFPLPASVVGRDPAAAAFALAPPPAGVLRVTIFEAAELCPCELLGLRDVALPPGAAALLSAVAPYCALELPQPPGGSRAGEQAEASAHKRSTLSPRFDEAFSFVVDDPATQRLRVALRAWDARALGAAQHSVMGETAVPIAGLRPGVPEDSFWALSMVVPKSVTVQGVLTTYRVPSFGGELEEVPAGRVRLGLLYTPFRGAPRADADEASDDAQSQQSQEEEDEDDDGSDDASSNDESSSDGGSSSEGAAEARREARRAARRAARRRERRLRGGGARRGVLFVRVERGQELRRSGGAINAPADAYVTVALAGERRRETRKTRVCAASRSPVWNADFAVFVEDAPRAELRCAAFDFAGVEAHLPLGELRLPLLDIIAHQGGRPGCRDTYALSGEDGGALQLWLHWRPY